MADKSSFRYARNGRLSTSHDRRRRANQTRKVSGRTGTVSSFEVSSLDQRLRCVSPGNDSCIAAANLFNTKPGTRSSSTSQMRSLCFSAAMMLSSPLENGDHGVRIGATCLHTLIGNAAGETSSISLVGVLSEQRSFRCRRTGDAKTIYRHLRQTCTSVYLYQRSAPHNLQKDIIGKCSDSILSVTCACNAPNEESLQNGTAH